MKNEAIKSVTIVSKNIRRFIERMRFQRVRKSAVAIQTNTRRSVATKQYKRDRKDIIKCQSVVRRQQSTKMRKGAISSAVRLQSMYRSYVQRSAFRTQRAAATTIATQSRGHFAKTRFQRQKRCVSRLQVTMRALLRQRMLANTRDMMFELCADGTQGEIEGLLMPPSVADYSKHFSREGAGHKGGGPVSGQGHRRRVAQYGPPDSSHVRQLLSIRHPQHDFCGILHQAARYGNNSIVQMLKPAPFDVLQKDSKGNGVAHYVARYPNLEIYEYLAEAMELKYNYNDLWRCGVLGGKDSRESLDWMEFEHGAEDEDEEHGDDGGLEELQLQSAKAVKVLKEGYLKKVRQC